jgi:hypothetical protein
VVSPSSGLACHCQASCSASWAMFKTASTTSSGGCGSCVRAGPGREAGAGCQQSDLAIGVSSRLAHERNAYADRVCSALGRTDALAVGRGYHRPSALTRPPCCGTGLNGLPLRSREGRCRGGGISRSSEGGWSASRADPAPRLARTPPLDTDRNRLEAGTRYVRGGRGCNDTGPGPQSTSEGSVSVPST